MGKSCSQNGNTVGMPLIVKSMGKRPVGRPRSRWEDNVRMDLAERGIESIKWIHLTEDRNQWRAFVDATLNLRVS